MIPHNNPDWGTAELDAATRVMKSGRWTTGEECAALEEDLCQLTQRKYATTVASGSSALRLSLAALGVGSGDEVVVPAYSCVALPNAVLALGAKPIAADIDPATYNISVASCEAVVSSKTRAIVAVHTFGLPAPIDRLRRVGVPVVEDCAHALGFEVDEVPIGGRGDIAITSFYATKLIGGGQGGAILTSDAAIDDAVKDLRIYADKSPSGLRLNDQMTDIEAAVARTQIERLETLLARRQEIAGSYLEAFRDLDSRIVRLPNATGPRCWYRFVIESHRGLSAKDIIVELEKAQIAAAQPVCSWLDAEGLKDWPSAEGALGRAVSLPLHVQMTKTAVEEVSAAVKRTFT